MARGTNRQRRVGRVGKQRRGPKRRRRQDGGFFPLLPLIGLAGAALGGLLHK